MRCLAVRVMFQRGPTFGLERVGYSEGGVQVTRHILLRTVLVVFATFTVAIVPTPADTIAGAGAYGTDCDLEVSLSNYPATVEQAGRLSFTATASNDCGDPLTFDRAVMTVSGPASLEKTLYEGRPVTVARSVSQTIMLSVPGIAPTGSYTVMVAIYRDGVEISTDLFDVEVTAGTCPSIVGVWMLHYEWDTDGPNTLYPNSPITFYPNGQFESRFSGGWWKQLDCDVDWLYDSGTHYWGTMHIGGDYMEGLCESELGGEPIYGVWDATRDE